MVVFWRTVTETGVNGFNLWRSLTDDEEATKLNGGELIAATGEEGAGTSYQFTDTSVIGAIVNNPETDTKREDISRSVKLTVESLPIGGDSKI